MRNRARKANTKYDAIRAGLIRRGSSLVRWSREQGYPPTTVYSAARGERTGKLSRKILQELESLTHA